MSEKTDFKYVSFKFGIKNNLPWKKNTERFVRVVVTFFISLGEISLIICSAGAAGSIFSSY